MQQALMICAIQSPGLHLVVLGARGVEVYPSRMPDFRIDVVSHGSGYDLGHLQYVQGGPYVAAVGQT